MDKLWYLSQINVFQDLPRSDLKVIGKMAPMSSVDKGTVISSPMDDHKVLYLLKKGRVRLYKINPEGKQFTLGILGDGNVFGEIETLSTGTRNAYVEAIEDTLLCILRKDDLEKLLQGHPDLAIKFLHVLTERLREAEEFLETLALGNVTTRLIYLLCKLAEHFSIRRGDFAQLELNLTHQELAEMVGSTRETVTVTLSHLSQEGIVRLRRRRVLINMEKARSFLDREEAS